LKMRCFSPPKKEMLFLQVPFTAGDLTYKLILSFYSPKIKILKKSIFGEIIMRTQKPRKLSPYLEARTTCLSLLNMCYVTSGRYTKLSNLEIWQSMKKCVQSWV
jgi:hypothetical protein